MRFFRKNLYKNVSNFNIRMQNLLTHGKTKQQHKHDNDTTADKRKTQ